MARKLITIQRIYGIQDIEGRDRVQKARIKGWEVIIPKGVYVNGDLVCFAEIDSLFPKDGNWTELEKFKYRIKTFKVNTPEGPIYGQGYVFPLERFHEIVPDTLKYEDMDENYNFIGCYRGWEIEGTDITDLLKVEKYEVPEKFVTGDSAGSFPTHLINKTDEERVQNCLSVLDEMRGEPYVIRQKVDGSSGSFLILPENDEFTVCTRNMRKKSPETSGKNDLFWSVARQCKIEEILRKYPDYAIQGEVAGIGIQKNRLELKGNDLFVFNIIYLPTRTRLNHSDFTYMMKKFREIYPDLKECKVIEVGDSFNYTLESLIALSNHKYDSGKVAEGIVIRHQDNKFSRALGGITSFKCISPEYLTSGGN